MSFSHDVAGGNGNLNVTSIKSPNYEAGVQGWSINKDGTAEFQDVVLPAGTSGTTVTFGATAPTSPSDGDVWYDVSAGLEANVWNGTEWVGYQIGPQALSGSITARSLGGITTTIGTTAPATGNETGDVFINETTGQLSQWSGTAWTAISFGTGTLSAAAVSGLTITGNTIDGAYINGGTITGAVFDQPDGTMGPDGLFLYSGTPALGDMILSIAQAAGTTDPYGLANPYPAGVTTYGSAGTYANLASDYLTFYGGSSTDQATIYFGGGDVVIESSTPSGVLSLMTDLGETSGVLGLEAGNTTIYGTLDVTGASTLGGQVTATGGTAAAPTLITTDTWHTMTLQNSWSAGSGYAQYRMLPDGNVQVRLQVTVGTATNGTTVWTAAAPYAPSTAPGAQYFPVIVVAGATAAQLDTPQFRMSAGGALSVANIPTGTTSVAANFIYALDIGEP